jgi:hypothetical protein
LCGSGSGSTHGFKIQPEPAPVGLKTRGLPETRTRIAIPSHTMGFVRNGHRIFWTAATLTPELSAITSASSDLFEELLLQFAPIFEEPTGLPPEGERSHRICLLPGTPPVVVWLYRYTHFQKQELERQCADILCTGIIRPNSSTFSAPVLLVKKSD